MLKVLSYLIAILLLFFTHEGFTSESHEEYELIVDTIQPETSSHSIVTLQTNAKIQECAAYCKLRSGNEFGFVFILSFIFYS